MTLADQMLDDQVRYAFAGYEWLGYDIKLVDGDLSFGTNGDLLIHTNPVESFVALLQYRANVAGNAVLDTRNPAKAMRAALAAIETDPRVQRVVTKKIDWDDLYPNDPTSDTKNYRVLVATVTIQLVTGDVMDNFVLPISFEAEAA